MGIRKKIHTCVYHICVIILGLAMLYPLLWMLGSSFKENKDIFTTAGSILPKTWNFSSYSAGWKGFGGITFATFFKNSFLYAILYTVGIVLSSAVVAFGFSRIKFRGRNIFFVLMILTLMLPGQVLQIPRYILFKTFDWLDSYKPMVVPVFFGSAFDIFMIMQFMRGIPKDFDEAAYIDGCSRFGIFARIILPMVTPVLVTVAIFSFYGSWGDFMGPLLYLNTPTKYPVSLALKMFSDPSTVSDWSAMFAMSVLSLIPVFVVFLTLQKFLLDGITAGGVKG